MSVKNLTSDEKTELLRYFVGNPPYLQDARYRELVEQFNATDERTTNDDVRYNVDYERDRIKDAEDETGSVQNDVGTVQGGKFVKPETKTK